MNDEHIHACFKLNCESQENKTHCCARYDMFDRIEAFCCSIDEFIDHHLLPHVEQHSFVPQLHYIQHEHEEEPDSTNSITESQNLVTEATQHSKLPEPHALGWTYIGVASGVIVLLIFVAVVLAIVYIFYHWRKKYGRDGGQAYYQRGHCGQEVVVFRSVPPNQPEQTTMLSNEPEVLSSTSSNNENRRESQPPPYSSYTKGTCSSCGDHNDNERRNSTKEKLFCSLPES
ncbi:uncharacterized protein LOC144422292 [Styela clava]